MCFHAFDQCFRLLLEKALQNPENMLKSYLFKLPITEKRTEKLVLVRFVLPLLYWFVFLLPLLLKGR